jgi:uncharacterized protein involved in outer membrane biogenesis
MDEATRTIRNPQSSAAKKEVGMKWVKRIVIGLVVVLVIVLAGAMFFMGSIIKTGVEQGGPAVLGVPVKLESALFRPLTGKVRLSGFMIGNPQGFKSESAFKLGQFHADIDVRSLFTDTIVIQRILIEDPVITFEGSLKGSNIGALMKKMEREGGAGGKPAEETPAKPEKPVKPGKKVRIDDFLFTGGRVNLSMGALTGGAALPIPLPPVHLTDIGKESDGVTPKTAVTEVMGGIMKAVMEAVGQSGKLLGQGLAKGAAGVEAAGKEAGVAVEKGAEAATEAAKAAGAALGGAATGLEEGASKLLGGFFKKVEAEPAPAPEDK